MITIADRCYRDESVPKRGRNTLEGRLFLRVVFRVIYCTREYDYTEGEEEHDHCEFVDGCFQGVSENLESHRMSGQFEDTEDTEETGYTDHGQRAALLALDR